MPLQSIVAIVLRLFCIQWFVSGVVSILALSQFIGSSTDHSLYLQFLTPAFSFLLCFVVWMLAPAISRAVTPRDVSALNISGVSRHDFYSFAFVFVGLNFFLTDLGWSLVYVRDYLEAISQTHPQGTNQTTAFYHLARHAVSLIAGCFCILFAGQFSKKLIRLEEKREATRPLDTPSS